MRPALLASLLVPLVVLACGGEPEAPAPPPAPPPLDTSPAERPDGAVVELVLDRESSLVDVGAALDEEARAVLPARIVDLVEAGGDLPSALRSALAPDRGLRALGFQDHDGGVEMVWAFGIGAIEESALATEPGAPRNARWVPGEPIAIAGDVAIVGPSRDRVEEALAYLAFTAMPGDAEAHALVVHARRALFVNVVRPYLDRTLSEVARDARRSAEAATTAHATPPVFGAPERFVDRAQDRLAELVALIPDVTDLDLTLRSGDGALRLELAVDVAEGSPLARLFAAMPVGSLDGLGALPADTMLGLVLHASAQARAERTTRALADLADVAADRLGEAERTALTTLAEGWDAALGETTLIGLGHTDAGLLSVLASPDAPAGAPDALFSGFWSPRARPYAAMLLSIFAGCDPTEPRGALPIPICGSSRFDAAHDDAPGLAVAVAPSGASSVARDTLAALRDGRGVLSASPDVARALAPHAGEGHFALAIVPSRILPWLAALRGRGVPVDAPPAAIVLSARPREGGITLLFTADAAAVEDAIGVGRMWSGP